MYKYTILIVCALIAYAAAKPAVLSAPLAYTSPAVLAAAPAPYVTATSSQVIARNHNRLYAAPYVATPFGAAYTASPYFAHYSAPYSYASSRLIASPYASTAYTAAVSPFGYAAPYQYAATAPYVI